MQILGKRSKLLLIVIAIVMLVAVGFTFAMWDTMSIVKATTGNVSYFSAQVGDVIEFGEYYQTGNRINGEANAEYEKTPIEWLVVDKDERAGQLTLMSKYILACGNYFGNYYDDGAELGWNYNNKSTAEVGDVAYNQAYVDSTARAFLNNLERLDMGGDTFSATAGYIPSGINSTIDGYESDKFVKGMGLLSSVGFSNKKYWTNYNTISAPSLDGKSGIYKRPNDFTNTQGNIYQEFYYQRPIASEEFKNRPATRGFFDEAFSDEQKSMIVPKVIAGYTGYRWPVINNNIHSMSYVEGTVDKVWLPSVTELNIMNSIDWNNQPDDAWTNPSDETGSTVFEYFKNYGKYLNPITGEVNTSVSDAIISERTTFAKSSIGNYSIPVYDKGTTTPKTAIASKSNSSDHYWTRSPASPWATRSRVIHQDGFFSHHNTADSYLGVRPCVVLKY